MWRDLLLRYRQKLVLLLVLISPVASMYFHGKTRTDTSAIERTLMAVTGPASTLSHDAVGQVKQLLNAYVLLTRTEGRNRDLERENRILLGEALRTRTLAEELVRVKKLCEFKGDHQEFTTVPARVVGRDVSQVFQVVRLKIDIAKSQVQEGQAVITHDGIVGRIEKVSGEFADVMLVTDARSNVHATVPGKGVVGSVSGKGKKGEFGAQFVYLDNSERAVPLASGDAVLTTGHDRVFPAGLEIGHIADLKSTRQGPYHEFVLAPAVAYATLEEVLVVTDYRGASADSPRTADSPRPSDSPKATEPPKPADSGKGDGPQSPQPPAKFADPSKSPDQSKPGAKRAVDPANTPDAPP
jgi:rod shape-determining protein MreC